jgi:hypothetical protein
MLPRFRRPGLARQRAALPKPVRTAFVAHSQSGARRAQQTPVIMSRAIKPPPRRRRAQPPVRSPPPAADDAAAADAGLPFAPAVNQGLPRTDIERVDERRIGSVEAIAHPEPEDTITGFVEPASDQNLEPPGR